MAGETKGGGPSRRSHTKSRLGCKTCKRRHIRCDEHHPGCVNCSKHQVRCDYFDDIDSERDFALSSENTPIAFTPGTESRIDAWQQTGAFPYPDLQVFPPPQTHEYTKTELRLIHHLSTITNDLSSNDSANLTNWTQKMPRFLSIAASYPYVMHALLSFSANHLAWLQSNSDIRNLQIQYGGTALRGLHEAIGNFSHQNADAVLAASLLLLWQATDWRSWSSLRAGIQSVLSAMQSWGHESIFAEYVVEGDLMASSFRMPHRKPSLSANDRIATLQCTIQAVQHLQVALSSFDTESAWIQQLLTYVTRLSQCEPAETPEDQFNQVYILRKWLFWVPVSLLQRQGAQGPAMLTLAHFYAVAVTLEPLFPDLGSSFCAAMVIPPLENILGLMDALREESMGQTTTEVATMMQFPRTAALGYQSRYQNVQQNALSEAPFPGLNADVLGYSNIGNLSPAFAPSHLHYGASYQSSAASSLATSAYLEVPPPRSGFSYGTESWGVMPSPGFAPHNYSLPEEQTYGGMAMGGFRSGTPSTEPLPGPAYYQHYQQ